MAYTGPKATIADLRSARVTRADASCIACRHCAEIELAQFRAEKVFVDIKPRLRCGKCGSADVDLMPDWRNHSAVGRIERR